LSEEKPKIKIHKNKVVTDNHLNFLFELHTAGVTLSQEELQLVKDAGYFEDTTKEALPVFEEINPYATSAKTEEQKSIDEKVEIVDENGSEIHSARKEEIQVSEWMPASTTEHTKEFIDWISSINIYGFSKRKSYTLLNLYRQQAYTWISENKSLSDFDDEGEREDYMLSEIGRCRDNTLYFANKYGYYKDGNAENGEAKFIAAKAHEIMFYLNDAGYSQAITKGRQMAATTTQMICDLKDVVFKRNYFMKFITEDKEKAQEIFEDKLKFPFSKLPEWMRPSVLNDRENFFKIGIRDEKGDREGVNSSIRVVAPKTTAISGGAPNKAKIDEAGNIGILSKMIEDQRPTMLWYNPATKKIQVKRQLIFWGTGGELEKGGKAFETEFMAIWNAWQENNFSSCIVPIFFDWTARPGIKQEDYDREKKVAYSKVGPEAKESIVKFHQTMPITLSDVFKTTGKTLVDEEFISSNKRRISDAFVSFNKEGKSLTKRGFFEPIYDESQPNNEHAYLPFKIIDANFIPTEDFDPRATVTIFMEPNKKWVNRYFQGTDPIMSDSGVSEFASAIWDKSGKTIPAIVSFRSNDPNEAYLQSTLLGLYYDVSKYGKTSVKELIESNIGPPYTQFKKTHGFEDCMIINTELPDYLVNHSNKNTGIGIDNKNPRTSIIINKLHEMISGYANYIYIERIFTQLETFVCTMTASGNETWGPSNKKYFRDDILFACVYAYICGECVCDQLIPMDDSKSKTKFKWVSQNWHDPNKDYQLVKRMIKVPVHG
jgi:hypothetical protein